MVDSLYSKALAGDVTACIFWLKNRRPSEWRDVQNIEASTAHYIISDRPMSEEEWIEQRTKLIDAKADVPSVNRSEDARRRHIAKPLELLEVFSLASLPGTRDSTGPGGISPFSPQGLGFPDYGTLRYLEVPPLCRSDPPAFGFMELWDFLESREIRNPSSREFHHQEAVLPERVDGGFLSRGLH